MRANNTSQEKKNPAHDQSAQSYNRDSNPSPSGQQKDKAFMLQPFFSKVFEHTQEILIYLR